jgi:hypothetical protein
VALNASRFESALRIQNNAEMPVASKTEIRGQTADGEPLLQDVALAFV